MAPERLGDTLNILAGICWGPPIPLKASFDSLGVPLNYGMKRHRVKKTDGSQVPLFQWSWVTGTMEAQNVNGSH